MNHAAAQKKPMTYDDVAEFFKKKTGHSARTRPMEKVIEWLENQPEIEYNEQRDVFFMKEQP